MACIALVMPVEANWCTQERMAWSKRSVSPASTSFPSQAKRNSASTATARLATIAASNSAVGCGASSGPASWSLASGIAGLCGESADEFIQLGQERAVARARVGIQILSVDRQVEKERFDFFLAQFFPPRAVP